MKANCSKNKQLPVGGLDIGSHECFQPPDQPCPTRRQMVFGYSFTSEGRNEASGLASEASADRSDFPGFCRLALFRKREPPPRNLEKLQGSVAFSPYSIVTVQSYLLNTSTSSVFSPRDHQSRARLRSVRSSY